MPTAQQAENFTWKFDIKIVHLFVQNSVHKNNNYESNNNFHST
jgi:hypothetical protein